MGFHIAWNFLQAAIIPVHASGSGTVQRLVKAAIPDSDLLAGGVFGMKSSLVACALLTATGVVLLVLAVQCGEWWGVCVFAGTRAAAAPIRPGRGVLRCPRRRERGVATAVSRHDVDEQTIQRALTQAARSPGQDQPAEVADVKQSRIVAAVFAAVLAATGAAPSRAQVAGGATIEWGWPGYGPYVPYTYGPYGYGWFGRWGACGPGACADSLYLRRAIKRELERLEYLRELEERAQRNLQSYRAPLYGARGDWPPATPEAQMQPAYRGSGEIRPEFSGTGQSRQDSVEPPR